MKTLGTRNSATSPSSAWRRLRWSLCILAAGLIWSLWTRSQPKASSSTILEDGSRLDISIQTPAMSQRNPYAPLKQQIARFLPAVVRQKYRIPLPRTLQAPDTHPGLGVWLRWSNPPSTSVFPLVLRIEDEAGASFIVPLQEGSNTRGRGPLSSGVFYQGSLLTIWPRHSKTFRVHVHSRTYEPIATFSLKNPDRTAGNRPLKPISEMAPPVSVSVGDTEFHLNVCWSQVTFDYDSMVLKSVTNPFDSGVFLEFEVTRNGQRQQGWRLQLANVLRDASGNQWHGFRTQYKSSRGLLTAYLSRPRLPTSEVWIITANFFPPTKPIPDESSADQPASVVFTVRPRPF